jgi:SAM-dependent methyltransferase
VPAPAEGFQPRAHWAPDTPLRRLLFTVRLGADLQTNTIYRDLRRELAGFSGRLLDIGCGNSPFRHLLDPARTQYQGIDVEVASSFGYKNPDTIYYDGKVIPFPDDSFDAVLCTEVLEHVPDHGPFVREMHRVLKPGGLALVTLPWSARFHYQPHDYHRYTPTMLGLIFAAFRECTVRPRGTDFSSIASKSVVAYVRNLLRMLKPAAPAGWLLLPFRLAGAVLGLPYLVTALLLGHAGILFGLGSTDDPLGYTIVLRK